MKTQPPDKLVPLLLSELSISQPKDIDLRVIASHLNATIEHHPLDGCAANIVGFRGRAIITVKPSLHRGRTRFSIAHELGHWLYDKKGLYACDTNDMSGEGRASPRETRANRFAAELLMPSKWFRASASGLPLDFGTVEELAGVYEASRSAVAIRLLTHGSYLGMLAWYDISSRKRLNWSFSPDLPNGIFPPRTFPADSPAFAAVVQMRMVRSTPAEVDSSTWLEGRALEPHVVCEQVMRVGRRALALVWWPDDRALSEVPEE